MPILTATQARAAFFTLLDAAEAGESVVLERRGKRFRVVVEPVAPTRAPTGESPLVIKDPELLNGQWTWAEDADGHLVLQVADGSKPDA